MSFSSRRSITSAFVVVILPGLLIGQAGEVHERSFEHDGVTRHYSLYVPPSYDGAQEYPLAINYHGYGIDRNRQRGIDMMPKAADTLGFLLAYPQGLVVNNPSDGPGVGWNFDGNVAAHDDVDFTSRVIDHIAADYLIDDTRVHATGWSMGSQMIWALACVLSDRIASVAGVAGPMDDAYIQSCDAGRSYSAMLIHGSADIFWPKAGVVVNGYVFSDPQNTPAFWANQNGCDSEPQVSDILDISGSDRSTVTLFEYQGCSDDSEVVYYLVNGGGHTWPGGTELPNFLGPVNRDLDASAVILDFFRRNPKPISVTSTSGGSVPELTYEIGQLFPNPTDRGFTVEISTSEAVKVNLWVSNVLGQQVQHRVSKTLAPGFHQIDWRTTGHLPPGTYFAALSVDERVTVKAVVFTR